MELKDELAKTSVIITCYDRNGNEVKRVTSADPGEVEDNEGTDNNGSSGSSGSSSGGSTGGNTGGDEEIPDGD